MKRLLLQFMLGVAVVLAAVGCQSTAYTDYAAFVREPVPTAPGQDYRIGVSDTVALTQRTAEGWVETQHVIGVDGMLMAAGLEPMLAAGSTLAELAGEINAGAANAESARQILVRIEDFASQKIFVFGQVQREGPQPYHGANTLLDAIAEAKLTPRAKTSEVVVLRPSPDGEFRRRLTVNFDDMIRRGDSTLNVVLDAGDVIYLPPTGLGSLGLALDQLFGGGSSPQASLLDAEQARPPHAAALSRVGPLGSSQDIEALRETLSQLNHQIGELRDTQQSLTEATSALRSDLTSADQSPPPSPINRTPKGVIFTSSQTPQGGAGESVRPPEGVRFWGP